MIKIGILGLGTVASGVVSIMNKHKDNIKAKVGDELEIVKVLVKDKAKKRDINIPLDKLTENSDDILNCPEIDLVVELIGGEEPAYQYIMQAIANGKSVVTANKLLIAKYGKEIIKQAQKNKVHLSYEGSVAGGIPIIRPLKESLAANRIEQLYGILNGTTNYILTKMTEEGRDFKEVLVEAQNLGYAESDPSSDIKGFDAAYKIAILSSIAFETSIDHNLLHVEGIENITAEDIAIAEELGYVIKLLAIGKRNEEALDIRVHPAFISKNHPLALVNNVYNAIYLQGDAVGDVMSYGKGAGQMPTGSAVVADIIQVAKDIKHQRYDVLNFATEVEHKIKDINEIDNSFYLRLEVIDKPGVLAQITKAFGDNQVSLASVIQKHKLSKVVPLVLITHKVKEENLNNSLKALKELSSVKNINSVIRVEEEL